jgi:selT/selW/selH-like putative selenoprotein
LGIAPELIKGEDGVFDVVIEGELIFSKRKAGRFPEHDEVLARLRRQQSGLATES